MFCNGIGWCTWNTATATDTTRYDIEFALRRMRWLSCILCLLTSGSIISYVLSILSKRMIYRSCLLSFDLSSFIFYLFRTVFFFCYVVLCNPVRSTRKLSSNLFSLPPIHIGNIIFSVYIVSNNCAQLNFFFLFFLLYVGGGLT